MPLTLPTVFTGPTPAAYQVVSRNRSSPSSLAYGPWRIAW